MYADPKGKVAWLIIAATVLWLIDKTAEPVGPVPADHIRPEGPSDHIPCPVPVIGAIYDGAEELDDLQEAAEEEEKRQKENKKKNRPETDDDWLFGGDKDQRRRIHDELPKTPGDRNNRNPNVPKEDIQKLREDIESKNEWKHDRKKRR
jgi:hypothetical protein